MFQPLMHMTPAVASSPRTAEPLLPRAPTYAVTFVGPEELTVFRRDWENLVAEAIEPNVFYEPWMLMPAITHLRRDGALTFALVHRVTPPTPPVLCGFFPFERRCRFRRLPVRVWGLWKHVHCVLCTPLLRREAARPALAALLRKLRADRHAAQVLDFSYVPAEGAFAEILHKVADDLHCEIFEVERFERALLRRPKDADAYIQAALAPKHRRELQRLRRRLGEQGVLTTRALQPDDDPAGWIDQFLALEQAGWKGAERTALACSAAERAFFTEVASAAHRDGRLQMLGLFLDDRPIAMKCNFRSGPGSFALKIAFDEAFDKYSPGVLLELDNIVAAQRADDLDWMDSCAVAHHPMIDRLWTDRRALRHLLIATGGWYGTGIVRLLPWARRLKRAWRRRRS